jgi:hypothetical protein
MLPGLGGNAGQMSGGPQVFVGNARNTTDAGDVSLTALANGVSSGIQAGDYAILIAHMGDQNDAVTGWTKVDAWANYQSTATDYCVVYEKLLAGSETAITESDGLNERAMVYVFRNVSQSSPKDVTPTIDADAESVDTSPPITTVTPGCYVLSIISGEEDGGDISAAPSGYSALLTIGGGQSDTGAAIKYLEAAGTETPGAFTVTGGGPTEPGGALTIAIRPG